MQPLPPSAPTAQTGWLPALPVSESRVLALEQITEAESGDMLQASGNLADGTPYILQSAGLNAGNYASIIVNGTEYAVNARGINIIAQLPPFSLMLKHPPALASFQLLSKSVLFGNNSQLYPHSLFVRLFPAILTNIM